MAEEPEKKTDTPEYGCHTNPFPEPETKPSKAPPAEEKE